MNWNPPIWAFWCLFSAGVCFASFFAYRDYRKLEITFPDFFSREDAQEIYNKVADLLLEMRNIAEKHSREIKGSIHDVFQNNERVQEILNEIIRVRLECRDRRLNKLLGLLAQIEYKINTYQTFKSRTHDLVMRDYYYRTLTDYISTKFRSRGANSLREAKNEYTKSNNHSM